MLRIDENILEQDVVAIKVDGVLDQDAILILKNVCDRYLKEKKNVFLNLEGLVHISREGRNFIRDLQPNVNIENIPKFM
jgi:hypothetical protein